MRLKVEAWSMEHEAYSNFATLHTFCLFGRLLEQRLECINLACTCKMAYIANQLDILSTALLFSPSSKSSTDLTMCHCASPAGGPSRQEDAHVTLRSRGHDAISRARATA